MRTKTKEHGAGATVPGRSLHLVDLENLAGSPTASALRVAETLVAYRRAAQLGPHDLVVLALNHGLFKWTAAELPGGWTVRTASGPDGADLALLDEAPAEWTTRRFGRLVIGSGDGIFAERASAVRRAGGVVWAVARPGSLSRRLVAAVDHVSPLCGSARPPGPSGRITDAA